VSAALTIRFAQASLERAGATSPVASIVVRVWESLHARPWTLLRGSDLKAGRELVINDNAAQMLGVMPGASITVHASCSDDREALPPVEFRVAAIVAFPFDTPGAATAATTAAALDEACGGQESDAANVILVTAKDDPAVAVADITQVRPDLRAFTNEQSVGRSSRAASPISGRSRRY
jgi:phosphotransferase system HPr-like phosphotransfer protein